MSPRTHETDRTTALAAIRGDASAIRRVWQDNRRWVAAILCAHKPREADLEDLLQDVATAMVQQLSTVREPEALRRWLRTIAVNAARAAGRKASVRRNAAPELRLVRAERGQEPAPAESQERQEQARRVMAMAMDLPEGYREPLLLRCVKGMSYRQISEILDLPETTIETRIVRARRMLRDRALDETNADPAPRTGPVSEVMR